MIEPADLPPKTPRIALAGKAWPVPPLVWLNLKECRAELLELTDLINEAMNGSAAPEGESEDDRGLRNLAVMLGVFRGLSNTDYDRLVMRTLHAGLSVAHHALTWEDFQAWHTVEGDRQMAWLTVRRQSGIFTTEGGDQAPGEDGGADQSPP